MQSGKPSATALLIAKSQLLLAGDSAFPGAVDAARADYYRAFVEAATGGAWRPGPAVRLWLGLVERAGIPGIRLHYASRKKCIERKAREFLEKNPAAQLVSIAAGFDPLADILSREYKAASFFELDHPATQRAKKAALDKLGSGGNLAMVPIDLFRDSIAEVLGRSAFSSGKPALFIAEGITMYLDVNDVKRLFRQVRSSTRNEETRFLFTYMNKRPSGSIQFENATRLADWWLRLKKESFRWGIATDDMDAFLAAVGWRLQGVDGDFDGGAAKGENICTAAWEPGGLE